MKEILFKEWMTAQAKHFGISWHGAYCKWRKGQIKSPPMRKVNSRVIWVKVEN